MKKNYIILFFALCGVISGAYSTQAQEINIIPRPVEQAIVEGQFTLTPKTVINIITPNDELKAACHFFSTLPEKSFGMPLVIKQGELKENAINISVIPTLKEEAYCLNVGKQRIDIKAGSPKAVFYAFQTLRQMMPIGIENGESMPVVKIQNVIIRDEPQYGYRGTMLDVCRHFFTIDEVKTFIDMLTLHKLDRFHWHLTDDQGWRIEIKKYPRLTEIGCLRKETVIGKNSGKYDGKPYGGFYTQEEIKEIVKYAADRYITVIPEVELPGHATAALTSYPELGCSGGPYEVTKEWGVFDDVFCVGKEKTFEFLQDVFDEIIPLFPSEYIHIGGDECPVTAWKKCPDCQQRIKQENLKNEEELQKYIVHRMENYLNSKGKKIIGWDEILERGVSQTATIMSWRGKKGGIEAAQKGNNVIMVPNDYAYLDYYQSRNREREPFTIGGFVDVAKVYSLEPVAGLTPEEARNVIGVQGNLWSEYMVSFNLAQYMLLPRMAAIAEVAWTPAEKKSYPDFLHRASILMERYKALGYNYAQHILSVTGENHVNEEKKCLEVALSIPSGEGEIRYTLDGSKPAASSLLYTAPIEISQSTHLNAQAFKNGLPVGYDYSNHFNISKAAFKDIQINSDLSPAYSVRGARTLTDGQRGTRDHSDGQWLGSQTDDLTAIIDLGAKTKFYQVNIGCLQEKGSWIYTPVSVKVYASDNGKNFTEIGNAENAAKKKGMDENGIKNIGIDVKNGNSRFIKVVAERLKELPEDHESAGKPAFVFIDEIEVY